MGYSVDALPVSMDQAVAQLSKVIDREGRHIHAHVHEHDHKSVESSQYHEHTRTIE
jgi:cytosine/adenosine deaminase-related metal-dependent hydrolase